MPKPTQAEVAELVTELRASQWPNATLQYRAADALEALAGEGAEPVVRQMPQPWSCPATAEICDRGCGAACEKLGMVTRNPAPDASPPMVPSESRTFTIGGAPPAKPAEGELPPLPEPTQEGCKCRKSRGYEWLEYSASEMRAYALRALRERT